MRKQEMLESQQRAYYMGVSNGEASRVQVAEDVYPTNKNPRTC
jgi:hypothetical protein